MDQNNKIELNLNYITFGKYKDKDLKEMLKDRKYCSYLIKESWFRESYQYLYNQVSNYDPKIYFFPETLSETEDFCKDYKYFNLTSVDNIKITLSDKEKFCYSFYLEMIQKVKKDLEVNFLTEKENPFDIKAPSKWLKSLEEKGKDLGVTRNDFKEFLSSYELENLTSIIEEIKSKGGIEYKGAKSYKIAKKRSSEQEEFWEKILKEKYDDMIGTQFKYHKCIFDFICIPKITIYECKLGLKDFNEEQFNKYQETLEKYNIIFLIGMDCVINMDMETIYTNDIKKYILYQCQIPLLKNPSKFDDIIFDFDIYEVNDLTTVI